MFGQSFRKIPVFQVTENRTDQRRKEQHTYSLILGGMVKEEEVSYKMKPQRNQQT